MDLVEGAPLAEKPNAASVLRCRWALDARFPVPYVLRVGQQVAAALEHLHAKGIKHGDVYAHNIVADPDGYRATLLDYGASFIYRGSQGQGQVEVEEQPQQQQQQAVAVVDFERLEVRAFGLLLADLVARCAEPGAHAHFLEKLVAQCLAPAVAARPTFAELAKALERAASLGSRPTAPVSVIPPEEG